MDNEDMIGLRAWLGPAAEELTADDIEAIAEAARRLNAKYPNEAFPFVAEAMLNGFVQDLLSEK